MLRICSVKSGKGVTDLRQRVLDVFCSRDFSPVELDACMNYMSLKIGKLSLLRLYHRGIELAEQHLKNFLMPMSQDPHCGSTIRFWIFDTCFHILTMYDHIGNPEKCRHYQEQCNQYIGAINHSWEHIDYYFKYRIRELNVLIAACFSPPPEKRRRHSRGYLK